MGVGRERVGGVKIGGFFHYYSSLYPRSFSFIVLSNLLLDAATKTQFSEIKSFLHY